MKKNFKVFCIALAIFLLLGLVSCKGKENINIEKQIAESIEEIISDFKDPNSVTAVSVEIICRDNKFARIKLSAKNSYGGSVPFEYYLVLKTFICDQALFDEVFANEKNEVFDGTGDYDNWYEFHQDYYGPGGTFEFFNGMNFFDFLYTQGSVWVIHSDLDDRTASEEILTDIDLCSEYKSSIDIGKVNKYLNEYKEEMGWR